MQIFNNLKSAKNVPMQALYSTRYLIQALTAYFNTVHKMQPGVAHSTAQVFM